MVDEVAGGSPEERDARVGDWRRVAARAAVSAGAVERAVVAGGRRFR